MIDGFTPFHLFLAVVLGACSVLLFLHGREIGGYVRGRLVRWAVMLFNRTDREVLLEALHELSGSEPAPEPGTVDNPAPPPQQSSSSSSSSTARQPIPDVPLPELSDDAISDTPPPAPPPVLPSFRGAALRAQLDLPQDAEWLTTEQADIARAYLQS